MNTHGLLAVLVVFGLLRLRRTGLLPWAGAWWAGIYVLLRFGFTAPIPASVIAIYMGIVSLAILAYMSSSEERREEVSGPLSAFIDREALYAPLLALTVVAIPALAAANVYVQMNVPLEPPFFPRTMHPASPTDITVHDKRIDLDAGDNPFRASRDEPTRTSTASTSRTGGGSTTRTASSATVTTWPATACSCTALDPIPTNFADQGTLADLRETFLLWRVSKGGPGMPEEGGPWDSAMPAWEKFLTEEEMWEAILFLYDFTGQKPRARETAH